MKKYIISCLFLVACNAGTTAPTRSVTSEGQGNPPSPEPVEVPYDLVCPSGSVHVSGEYCPNVEEECLEWLSSPTKLQLRCARFKEPSKCLSTKRVHKDFCMDQYEWPNKAGESPPIDMTWFQASKSCEGLGKRLCTAEEWTFACEGEQMLPYPYGYDRDDTACVIDKKSMNPELPRSEWPKFYSAEPSGSRPRCVSPFGVYDMTGNVDEFVYNVGGRKDRAPYFSGLKGGYWGPVRTRCRPMTTAHGPSFSFYQAGFRCCQNSKN